MADDDKISFLLDLDVTEFTEKGLQAKGIVEKLGDSENITGLLEGLTSAGAILGTVGIAAYAFKKALDLTTEAEDIQRVNDQFETLSVQAGIAPDKLKKGLEESAKGLISTDDLLKIANESIVKMGGSADKLPQIMDIAMKATQVYGGNAKTNFEQISNAIANGNTRILKHYGIIVDTTKAEQEFAKANGTTADQLSEVGKRQAILNAALASGAEGFKNIELNTKSATSILQTLKVTFTEIGQTFSLVFEKTVGPGIRAFLGGFESLAHKLKLTLQSSIGDGAEAANAKLELTQNNIAGIEKQLEKLEKIKGTAMDFAPGDTQVKIMSLKKQLEDYRNTLKTIQVQNKENAKEEVQDAQAAQNREKIKSQNAIVDQEKAKKNRQAFNKEMEKLDKELFTAEQNNVQSIEQIEKQTFKQRELNEKDHINRLTQIQNNKSLTDKQKKQLMALEDKRYQEIREADAENEYKLEEKLLDTYVKHSENAWQGITRAAQQSAFKSRAYLQDFGKQGQEVMQSFSTYSTQAFESMGQAAAQGQDVAGAAAQAMKAMFLNVIADRAIATGSALLLEGLWPPNPIALGAGAGLLALGGALRTFAGGTGTTVGGAVGGGVGTSGIGVATQPSPSQGPSSSSTSDVGGATTATTQMDQQQQQVQRTVQVNIAGNYLETDSTKRMLMDLMRQESDATGFSYNQIGA